MSTFKIIQIFLMVIVLSSLPATSAFSNTKRFPDIANSYAATQIQNLAAKGIVVGDEQGNFRPKAPVTRAEFVTMLNRAIGILPLPAAIPAFRDVPSSSWEYPWVQAGVSLGIVNGVTEETFAPKRSITRQEAAALLVRALRENPGSTSVSDWIDRSAASTWAIPYIQDAMARKLMTGYQGMFRPQSALTREEIAVILDRIVSRMDKPTTAPRTFVELGWQYMSTRSQYIDTVKQSSVSTLSPRWYFLEQSGTISDHTDTALVSWAHENGKTVWPLFGNRFNAELTHKLLSSKTSRKALVDQIARYVEKYQLDGINIDFEAMYPRTRQYFTDFVDELAEELHDRDALLSVDVPPDLQAEWSDSYDYEALGESADYIVVMLYEEHWLGSPKAGSVSSLPWFDMHLKRIKTYVPQEKIIAGMPLYTRDWRMERGSLQATDLKLPASYQMVRDNAAKIVWNPELGQYVATYQTSGASHTIWLEESRSLAWKARAALKLGVGGIAYWYIGSESADVWRSLQNAKQYHDVLARQPDTY